ncbi:MAG: pilus assembly protein TadG-related protein [Myxococcota bacterium]
MDTSHSARRRGAVAILVAVFMIALVSMAAFVVDVGLLRLWRQQLQGAVDAGAHAGTTQLDGTEEGLARARQAAVLVAGANSAGGDAVAVDLNPGNDPSGDVVLGYWEDDVFYAYDADPSRVTTVQVTATARGLRTYFAPVAFAEEIDYRNLNVSASSTVLGGGPAEIDCPLPIAVPHCSIDRAANLCDIRTKLNPDNNDNAGWSRVGSQRPSANTARNAIYGYCPTPTTVNGEISLNNGVIASATDAMSATVSASTQMWDVEAWGTLPPQQACSSIPPAKYGRVVIGRIPVFRDASECTSTRYNGTGLDVVGFATAVVYDVCANGPASGRSISVRYVCDLETESRGGGGYFGTVVPPQIVR